MKSICVCSSEKMNPSKGKIAQFHILYSCICYGQDSTWWYLYVNMNKYWIHIRRRQNARMKNWEGFCNLSYSLSISSESHFGVENSILSYQPRFSFCCLYQSPVLLKTHSLPKWILNAFFNLEMPTDEDQFPGSSSIKAGWLMIACNWIQLSVPDDKWKALKKRIKYSIFGEESLPDQAWKAMSKESHV